MPDENFSDPNSGETNQPASKFDSGKTHAAQAAEDLRAAAEAKAQELRAAAEAKAQEWKGRAESAYSEAQTRARTMKDEGEQYVRENPSRAVVTALGIGFILGLVFRR